MKELCKTLTAFIAGGLAILINFIDGLDGMFKALVIAMLIDFITGVMVAYKNENLNSKCSFQGIIKKFTMCLIVYFSYALDLYVFKGSDIGKTATLFLFISNEGISILENANKLGIRTPKKLQTILAQFEDEEGIKDEVIKNE